MANKDKSKQDEKTSTHVDTVRVGAIAANIFRGQSQDGFDYHYFVLSRSWKSSKQGTEGYSNRYFPRNAEAIGEVAHLAAERCESLDEQLTQSTKEGVISGQSSKGEEASEVPEAA